MEQPQEKRDTLYYLRRVVPMLWAGMFVYIGISEWLK